jgi:hypothetical protein
MDEIKIKFKDNIQDMLALKLTGSSMAAIGSTKRRINDDGIFKMLRGVSVCIEKRARRCDSNASPA